MNDQQRAAMIRPRGKSEAPHMIAAYRAMQMAYQALRNCCGTLTYVDDKHRVVREPTVAGAVRALAAIEEALAQPQSEHPPSRHCECAKCVEYFGDSVCESSFHPETWKPQDHSEQHLNMVQGEWVDLTDSDIDEAICEEDSNHEFRDATETELARSVIAKFKEKNTPPVVPQGEPVAWMRKPFGEDVQYCEKPFTTDWTPLYTAPPSTSALVEAAIEATKEKIFKEYGIAPKK